MTADSPLPSPESDAPAAIAFGDRYSQVHLKTEAEKLLLILPPPSQKDPANDWAETWQDLKYCLTHHERTWASHTPVHLLGRDRLLDNRQLQSLAEALAEVDLKLTCIHTSRRQTAVAAATAGYSVEQESLIPALISPSIPALLPLAEPLYLKTTVRSGATIRHPGMVIILGDVNPGGEVIADGDIIIWGGLRGIAHAGAKGNQVCRIMALRMEATQLRIASRVARVPTTSSQQIEPEVAYVTSEGIRISQALNFAKTYGFSEELGLWREKKEEMIQYVNAQKLLEEELKKTDEEEKSKK